LAPTVVLTQAREGSDRLAATLRGEGITVVEVPLIRIEPLEGPPLDPTRYDWLVLTSARAVEPLLGRLTAGATVPRVAAVGPGTAEALRERGIEPALVARVSTQEGLVAELRPALAALGRPPRVLFAGAEGARDVLVRELGADFLPLYRSVEVRPDRLPDADLVVLASASAARAFSALEVEVPCVSIGPVTSTEARRLGLRVVAEARSHDVPGLVEAVRTAMGRAAPGAPAASTDPQRSTGV
jgi:uroporphyrinogen III methyltransferase/synthase